MPRMRSGTQDPAKSQRGARGHCPLRCFCCRAPGRQLSGDTCSGRGCAGPGRNGRKSAGRLPGRQRVSRAKAASCLRLLRSCRPWGHQRVTEAHFGSAGCRYCGQFGGFLVAVRWSLFEERKAEVHMPKGGPRIALRQKPWIGGRQNRFRQIDGRLYEGKLERRTIRDLTHTFGGNLTTPQEILVRQAAKLVVVLDVLGSTWSRKAKSATSTAALLGLAE